MRLSKGIAAALRQPAIGQFSQRILTSAEPLWRLHCLKSFRLPNHVGPHRQRAGSMSLKGTADELAGAARRRHPLRLPEAFSSVRQSSDAETVEGHDDLVLHHRAAAARARVALPTCSFMAGRKQLRVKDLGQHFQTFDNARPRAIKILIAVGDEDTMVLHGL